MRFSLQREISKAKKPLAISGADYSRSAVLDGASAPQPRLNLLPVRLVDENGGEQAWRDKDAFWVLF